MRSTDTVHPPIENTPIRPCICNLPDGGLFVWKEFFLYMVFAVVSTVIAVIENIVTYVTDATGWSRKKSVSINFVLLFLSLPCIFGFDL